MSKGGNLSSQETTFSTSSRIETQIKRQEEEKDQYPVTSKHSLPKLHENSQNHHTPHYQSLHRKI
jgi:hypothetical protein